ncbi:hypothetical protein SV7mr_29890 [Stieleria bergensis]|uniref:Uncharacterized protein n=1 Tax=Stieleria bergensis TaxID=2528025 RepID=A0A517SWF6_9BACT|nr:hypothetical protein SV7mr_29890 [Planctomycetes bacterium SV_7m_r]
MLCVTRRVVLQHARCLFSGVTPCTILLAYGLFVGYCLRRC